MSRTITPNEGRAIHDPARSAACIGRPVADRRESHGVSRERERTSAPTQAQTEREDRAGAVRAEPDPRDGRRWALGRAAGRRGALVLGIALASAPGAAQAAASALPGSAGASRPDLTAAKVRVGTPSIAAGRSVRVSVRIRNAGGLTAKRSRLAFLLSRDVRRSAGDVALSAVGVKAVQPRTSRHAATTFRLPATVAAGTYRVLACADAARSVRERNERNNCAVSRPVTVVLVAPAPLPETGIATNPGSGDDRTPEASRLPAGDPLDVKVSVDEARAATATIGALGGSLAATAADGTVFTLEIPAGALMGDTDVTVTPVTGIDGLPFAGGLQGAVQFGPDGLELLKPASLSIAPTRSVSGTDLTGFGWRAQGDDFHMEPVVTEGGGLVLEVLHFSGAGTGSATDEERARQLTRVPRSTLDAFRQEISDAIRRGDDDAVSTLLRKYLDQVLKPHIAAALTSVNESVVRDTALAAIDWWRQAQLLAASDDNGKGSIPADVVADLETSIEKLLEQAYRLAYATCPDPEAKLRMFFYARNSQLIQLNIGDLNELEKCATIRLRFSGKQDHSYDYIGHHGTGGRYTIRKSVNSEFPLTFLENGNPTTSGELQWTEAYEYAIFPLWCGNVWTAAGEVWELYGNQNGMLSASAFGIDMPAEWGVSTPRVTMRLRFPQPPTMAFRWSDCGGSGGDFPAYPQWVREFEWFFPVSLDANDEPDGFDLKHWKRGQGDVYAYIEESNQFAQFKMELVVSKP